MDDLQRHVIDGIREDELVAMATELIDVPSPPGEEAEMGDYLARRLSELGLRVRLQEVEAGRNNVIGRLPGTGGGPTLMFSGHLDTSTTGREQQTWGGGGPGSFGGGQARARVEDGWIHGLGASNMKGAFAAYWGAVRGLQRASVQLAGDILVTGLVGETERAPIDQYQGIGYRGGHVGARYLVSHGVTADFAIIGEPTGLRVQIGETGFCFARISVAGRSQHTWCKELGIDPIDKMMRVVAALKAWEPVFQQRHPHPTMETRVGIGAIQGGFPYKPSKCPAPFCNLYVDLRLLPGQSFLETTRELQGVLAEVARDDPEFKADVELYLSGSGFELDRDEPLVQAVARAHAVVHDTPAPYAAPNRYAVSSDAGPMMENGIRALTYGPGGVATTGQFAMYDATQQLDEILGVDNLLGAARVYALAALDLCAGRGFGTGDRGHAEALTA
jgi:acetylornithine deacetylase/succinyl-diaminopimelate desuccinylase-like protein